MNRLVYIVLIGVLLSITYAIYTLPNQTANSFATANNTFIPYTEHYIMSGTAYTDHIDCIKKEWNDGITSTGIEAREGIVAINIDLMQDGTPRINSVLKIGQIIYVKGQFIEGIFSVEDTGYFRVKYLKNADSKDLTFDIYNLDFYKNTIEEARGFGIQYPIEVWVIGEKDE